MSLKEGAIESSAGEPWGRRLWLALALVLAVAFVLDSYKIGTWPMADDEVPTLVELHLQKIEPGAFSVPAAQLERLPKALPVYYAFQGLALRFVPHNELGFRIPALICALATVALVFITAARWRGLWYAAALAIVMNFSQLFVYLAQIDRFYSMPLLLLIVTLVTIWLPREGVAPLALTALMTVATILAHNVTIGVFGLTFAAAAAGFIVGRVPLRVLLRSGVAAALSVIVYFAYVKPLLAGWNSTGNPTPVLVSFVAHATVPVLALAFAGCWIAVSRAAEDRAAPAMIWCGLMLAGTLCFLQLTGLTWNPRYFLFFMPPMWAIAAHAMEYIARKVGYRSVGAAWYACVLLLMMPNLLSHLQDGSRHDYRQAAEVLRAKANDGQPILSDDAETISYYLPIDFQKRLSVRTKVKVLPASEFFLVTRTNAWTALPQIPNRRMDLLAEIYRRRFDQFSHILRVYRVAPIGDRR